jgi:hypothetical protein
MKTLITISIILFLSINSQAQSNENKFSQFVITNLDTREQAVEIDQFIRAQIGIVISRTDINSKKFLCIYTENSGIDRLKIDEWMARFEMRYKCYREGVHTVDPIIDQKTDCN